MTIPQAYPIPAEAAIATYNWTDIAEGTGYVKFYLGTTEDSVGKGYLMRNLVFYSHDIDMVFEAAYRETGWVNDTNLLFDLSSFNLPQIVKGTFYVNFTSEYAAGTGAAPDAYFKVKIQKYDGTNAVTIGTVQTANQTDGWPDIFSLKGTLTQTHFKRGEILRCRVEIWGTNGDNTGDGNSVRFGTDPMNRDGTYITPSTETTKITRFEVSVPFRQDL